MSKKITGRVHPTTRNKLEAVAASKFKGLIGKATIYVIGLALDRPDHANTMQPGEEKTCSVQVDELLANRINAFQAERGVAKLTQAGKQLIEIGLSIIDADEGVRD